MRMNRRWLKSHWTHPNECLLCRDVLEAATEPHAVAYGHPNPAAVLRVLGTADPSYRGQAPVRDTHGVQEALKDRLGQIVRTDRRHSVDELQRQFAYDRAIPRLFPSDDANRWVLKGGGALLARLATAQHSKDVDVFTGHGPVAAADRHPGAPTVVARRLPDGARTQGVDRPGREVVPQAPTCLACGAGTRRARATGRGQNEAGLLVRAGRSERWLGRRSDAAADALDTASTHRYKYTYPLPTVPEPRRKSPLRPARTLDRGPPRHCHAGRRAHLMAPPRGVQRRAAGRVAGQCGCRDTRQARSLVEDQQPTVDGSSLSRRLTRHAPLV
jgi:hypothetical protein